MLLAWEMNGAPLTPDHGAPLRVVVPGYIGARSVKWLTGVRALAEPSQGYYQAVAYRLDPGSIALGAVAVNADILAPADGASRCRRARSRSSATPSRATTAGSCAWTSPATAARRGARPSCCADLGPWAWRRWRLVVEVAPGPLELVARAWDSAAATQPEHAAAIWNPGGYANNSWARVEVSVASSSR